MCHFSQKPHNKLCCGGEDLRYLIASGKLEQAGKLLQQSKAALPVSLYDRKRNMIKTGSLAHTLQPRPHSSHSLRPPTDTSTAQRLSLTPPPPPPPPCSPSVMKDKSKMPDKEDDDHEDDDRSKRSNRSGLVSIERAESNRSIERSKETRPIDLRRIGSDGSVHSFGSNSPIGNESLSLHPPTMQPHQFSDESDREQLEIVVIEERADNFNHTKSMIRTTATSSCRSGSSLMAHQRSLSKHSSYRENTAGSGGLNGHGQRRAQTNRGCTLRSMFGCWATGRELPPLAPSALAAGGFERPSSAGSFSADDERSPAKKTRHSCRPDKVGGCGGRIRGTGSYCTHCAHSSPSSNGSGTTRTAIASESGGAWPGSSSPHTQQPIGAWKTTVSSSSRICSTRQSIRSCDCGSDLCSEPRSFGVLAGSGSRSGSRSDIIRATASRSLADESVTSVSSSIRTNSERNLNEPIMNRSAFDSPDRSNDWLNEPQARGLSASPQIQTLDIVSVSCCSSTMALEVDPVSVELPDSNEYVEQLHEFQRIYAANQTNDGSSQLDHCGSDSNNNHPPLSSNRDSEGDKFEPEVARFDHSIRSTDEDVHTCQQHQAASTVQSRIPDCSPCPTPVSSTSCLTSISRLRVFDSL